MKIELKDLSNLKLLEEYKKRVKFLTESYFIDRCNPYDLETDTYLTRIQEEISSRMIQPEVVKLKIK